MTVETDEIAALPAGQLQEGAGSPVAPAPSAWSWSRSSPADGFFELVRGGRRVAELLWLRPGVGEFEAMDRIVASLNRPAIDCSPSAEPVWSWSVVRYVEGVIPVWVGFTPLGDLEAIQVAWWFEPSRLVEWCQRIVDGLNAQPGVPAVRVARAVRP